MKTTELHLQIYNPKTGEFILRSVIAQDICIKITGDDIKQCDPPSATLRQDIIDASKNGATGSVKELSEKESMEIMKKITCTAIGDMPIRGLKAEL